MKHVLCLLTFVIFTTLHFSVFAFGRGVDTLTVVSYNIENFFDPIDDPEKNDNEFTPDGSYHWTDARMKTKALRVARVIGDINSWTLPDIVGLCEIEGPDAVDLLLRYGKLRKYYKAVAFPTSDKRGIATALLYRKDRIDILESRPIVTSVPEHNFYTRDILYTKTKAQNDTLHIFVNHWPSKRGGSKKSDTKRDTVAYQLRLVTDSIIKNDSDAKIVILGDFNDTADAPSLTEVLGVTNDLDEATTSEDKTLVNLSVMSDDASYKYRGDWRMIDHIIVSKALFKSRKCLFEVFKPDYLLQPEPAPYIGNKPRRLYLGQKYNDGYSDHLPVITKIITNRTNNKKEIH